MAVLSGGFAKGSHDKQKEFKSLKAGEALTLEFIAAGQSLTAASAPILSALEVFDEAFPAAQVSARK